MASIDLNAIVDNWVDICITSSILSDNLPEEVKIYKGVRRIETISDKFAIFIYRDRISEQDLNMGKSSYDIEPIINFVCVIRSPFNPEKLEEYQNNLSSNILNVIFDNKSKDGDNGWSFADHQGSQAITVRNEDSQDYEIEIVSVRLGKFLQD